MGKGQDSEGRFGNGQRERDVWNGKNAWNNALRGAEGDRARALEKVRRHGTDREPPMGQRAGWQQLCLGRPGAETWRQWVKAFIQP